MSNQQVESATPTRLSTLSSALHSQKLRIAGRLLHDDAASSVIMIHDGEDALLVDVSLCLSPARSSPWLRESKAAVMALGYLERSETAFPIPVLHAHAPPVAVNPHLILRAIVLEEAGDLDLDLWNRSIQAREDWAQRHNPSSDK